MNEWIDYRKGIPMLTHIPLVSSLHSQSVTLLLRATQFCILFIHFAWSLPMNKSCLLYQCFSFSRWSVSDNWRFSNGYRIGKQHSSNWRFDSNCSGLSISHCVVVPFPFHHSFCVNVLLVSFMLTSVNGGLGPGRDMLFNILELD